MAKISSYSTRIGRTITITGGETPPRQVDIVSVHLTSAQWAAFINGETTIDLDKDERCSGCPHRAHAGPCPVITHRREDHKATQLVDITCACVTPPE